MGGECAYSPPLSVVMVRGTSADMTEPLIVGFSWQIGFTGVQLSKLIWFLWSVVPAPWPSAQHFSASSRLDVKNVKFNVVGRAARNAPNEILIFSERVACACFGFVTHLSVCNISTTDTKPIEKTSDKIRKHVSFGLLLREVDRMLRWGRTVNKHGSNK